jgi:stringent starvation protein B
VNPFLVVRVNGRDVTVPVGARLSAAIQAAGVKVPATVLPHLRVTKLFHGKPSPVEFDRQSSEILNLQLTGGEKLTWLNDTH